MRDESMPILAKSDNGEMMINTVPDQDIRPEPVAEETKEQTIVDSKVNKQENEVAAPRTQRVASHRLFLDDIEHQSFVRRLQWSPDGNFLLTPSACYYDL